MIVGIAVLASNAVAGAWGAGPGCGGLPVVHSFWWLLRVAQATVAVQVALGLILLARGSSAPDGLHVAYGVALLAVIRSSARACAWARPSAMLEDVADLEALDRRQQVALARRVARSPRWG